MSAANVTLARCWRWVGPVAPVQGVKPRPTYLPIAQMRPEARSVRVGFVEARGSSTARAYMLSGKVHAQSGKEAGFVRQSDIDKVRYPELIMQLAKQQGGSVATRDVENLLHLHRKQAYRLLVKLVDDGDLVLVGRGGGAHYEITEKGWVRRGH